MVERYYDAKLKGKFIVIDKYISRLEKKICMDYESYKCREKLFFRQILLSTVTNNGLSKGKLPSYYHHLSCKFKQPNLIRIASTLRDFIGLKIYSVIKLKVMSISEQKVSDLRPFFVEISDIFRPQNRRELRWWRQEILYLSPDLNGNIRTFQFEGGKIQRIRTGCNDTQNIQSRFDIELHIIFKRYNKSSIF